MKGSMCTMIVGGNMIPFVANLETDGFGLWSSRATEVRTTHISTIAYNEDFGELRVYFDPETWDVVEDGLIYTDDKFEKQLQAALQSIGLAGEDVFYSEQGMQGRDYVSLDVGKAFIDSWNEKYAMSPMEA